MQVLKNKRIRFLGIVSFILITLCFSLIFSDNYIFTSAAEADKQVEEKTYCKADLEDNFNADSVIIVLNKEATRKFLTYAPEDFPEIECGSVEDITNRDGGCCCCCFCAGFSRHEVRGFTYCKQWSTMV